MRLLFLTSRQPWPPDRGDKLRTFNLLKRLSKKHEIFLVSFFADKDDGHNWEKLAPYCKEIHTVYLPRWRSVISVFFNFWRGFPLQVAYYRSMKMSRLIDQLMVDKKIQAVYVHLFRMTPYVSQFSEVYRIIDLTDVISHEISRSLPYRPITSRFLYRLEQRRIAANECQIAQWANETWLVSEPDVFKLNQNCPGVNVYLIPNGVNLTEFFPKENVSLSSQLVFVGNLSVFHNIDAITYFIQDILPLIRESVPECKFTIIGAGENSRVRQLAQVPGVRLAGFVENLNDELNAAMIFIAPLRFSAGVQNKVLEAMAAGLPVVATSNVVAGLGAEPGREILEADSAQEFAAMVIGLLGDQSRREALGLEGRRFVEKQFSWQAAVERMNIIGLIVKQSDDK